MYDAFLDPARAGKFLFATATGHIVRCEIAARVGGTFTIVDCRAGENVAHTGQYVTLDRPRLIVLTLSVEKYSSERSTVTIEIAPLRRGCELTLTHELTAAVAPYRDRTEEGWHAILDVAAEILVDEAPTCGIGIAQHASGPAQVWSNASIVRSRSCAPCRASRRWPRARGCQVSRQNRRPRSIWSKHAPTPNDG